MTQNLEILRIFSKPLLLVFGPFVMVWLATSGKPSRRAVGLVSVAFIVLMSCYPILAIAVNSALAASIEAPTAMMGMIYDGYEISNGSLHGLAGWEGVDIAAGCGAAIYAPFAGKVTYNGLDGLDTSKGQATMLTIEGDGLTLTLLHGDFIPAVGTAVAEGQVIGYEASHGESSGCHSHVILRENGRTVNYLEWMRGRAIKAADVTAGKKPLKISWYDPDLGGINCMAPCDTMASGAKITSTSYGHTAACIPEWTRARRVVVIPGIGRFTCLDTGGAIKEQSGFIWIDLLLHQPIVPFGTLIDDWYLE